MRVSTCGARVLLRLRTGRSSRAGSVGFAMHWLVWRRVGSEMLRWEAHRCRVDEPGGECVASAFRSDAKRLLVPAQ